MNKKVFISSLISSGILIGLLILPVLNRKLVVFPSSRFGKAIEAYTSNPLCTIDEFSFNYEELILRFTLRESPGYPDAFIIFWLDNRGPWMNLSRYSSVSVKIDQAPNWKAVVFIKTYMDGVSVPAHEQAHRLRHNEASVMVSSSIKEYEIPVSEFITPPWWFIQEGVDPDGVEKDDFSQAVSVDIHFFHRLPQSPDEIPHTFVLRELAFYKKPPVLSFILLPFVVLGDGFLILFWLKRKKKKPLPFIEDDLPQDGELTSLLNFIKGNYKNPEISTAMIEEKTGIRSSRTTALIRKEYSMTFKQLIIKIRLNRAKELLTRTGLSVTEIALEIGFNDISYFHKLFKQAESMTPRKYRGKHKGE